MMYDSSPMMRSERTLPSVMFSAADIPDIKSWEVGKEYYLVIRVEMKSKTNVSESKNPEMLGNFRVTGVKVVDNNPVTLEKLERQTFESKTASILSGKTKAGR